MSFERVLRWALVSIAVAGLAAGIFAHAADRSDLADLFWTLATAPVVAGLAVSIVRDLLAGRFGVDAIALVSMSAALALGQPLAGAVVALMYSGGNVLEEIAVARAEHDLRSLVDRAPREAHRRVGDRIEEVPISAVAIGDQLLVRAGEVVPVDGVVTSIAATIDESALTGEPIPVVKARGAAILSGSLNAGETFELTVSAAAGESTYAGIVRLVTAAQTAKAPFVRLADRYALIFLPVTLALAFVAWLISGDLIRSLAVLVAATPCPLILAAPVAFIAGVAQAARRGILVKGGGPLEALARAHTVLFDKTGTLTVGGARLLSVEVAPGETADEVLMLGASLEQASHHVVASAIVEAGAERGLSLKVPEQVSESMGSGLQGMIDGRHVAAGSRDMIFAGEPVSRMGIAGDPARLVAIGARRFRRGRGAADRRIAARRRAPFRYAAGDPAAARGGRRPHGHGHRRSRRRRAGDRRRARSRRGAGRPRSLRQGRCRALRAAAASDHHGRRRHQRCAGAGFGRCRDRARRARRQRLVGSRRCGDPRRPPGSGRRSDRDRATGAADRHRKHRRRYGAFDAGDAGRDLRLADAGAGGHRSGVDRRCRDPQCTARLDAGPWPRRKEMTAAAGRELHRDHLALIGNLDRLRSIADALDDATPESGAALIAEANKLVQEQVVVHERDDEGSVYPRLAGILRERHSLSAMSRAHREILHLARLLARVVEDLPTEKIDRYLIRDAQRVIEAIETLVRMHTAQEEDIYEAVAAH